MSDESKNICISHAPQDGAVVQELKGLLAMHGYSLQHSSSESPLLSGAAGAHRMTPRIDRAGALLVLISPAIRTRPWTDKEIEYAERQGKRIVGVYVLGGQDADLPVSFQMYGDALVNCQVERVVDAVNGTINTWCNPDGSNLVPERDIERYNCGEPTPE
ncbi:TIR domain-containing protein [Stigmatella aurantiaca]|uniref:Conserved uncharacterized protein n=1 Tax=Stigmatella aurantiaca (strain DW4/3-1) TaxID=378806 RepID=E3G0G3_STIAD|nr:TIR domain-containing protein [Stigmatella aurantiaca]ADO73728.1 conserved uncharacterized protein [Stigmatella aurantiaca DW4/3-1]